MRTENPARNRIRARDEAQILPHLRSTARESASPQLFDIWDRDPRSEFTFSRRSITVVLPA